MTSRLAEAFEVARDLPEATQNDIADLVFALAGAPGADEARLTPEQMAEVRAAIAEDKWIEGAELDRFFERLLQ